MAATINASTSAGVVTTADTSGNLNLQSNGTTIIGYTSTGVTVTGNLTATGNMAGNGPAFSAYRATSNQALSYGVTTKLQFQAEKFDTASCYDVSNYRFTPNVAGYYQVNVTAIYKLTVSQQFALNVEIFKNGVTYTGNESDALMGSSLDTFTSHVTGIIYMNGSTDYLEIYGTTYNQSTGAGTVNLSPAYSGSGWSAALIRSA